MSFPVQNLWTPLLRPRSIDSLLWSQGPIKQSFDELKARPIDLRNRRTSKFAALYIELRTPKLVVHWFYSYNSH